MLDEKILLRFIGTTLVVLALQSSFALYIEVESDPNDEVIETNEANNIAFSNAEVIQTDGFSILFVPVDINLQNPEERTKFVASVSDQTEYLVATYPIVEQELTADILPSTFYTADGMSLFSIMLSIRSLNFLLDPIGGKYDFIVGLVPENWFSRFGLNSAGINFLVIPGAVLSESSAKVVTAHELGHEFGLCDEYNGYCGNVICTYEGIPALSGSGCTFCPNPFGRSCSIGGSCVDGRQRTTCDGESDLTGFWVEKRTEIGTDHNYHSFMGSLGTYHWASKDVYNHLLSRLTSFWPLSLNNATGGTAGSILISGLADKNGWVGLEDFYMLDSDAEGGIPDGNYSLKLLDASDNVLLDQNFGVSFVMLSDPPIDLNTTGFVFSVPFPEGTSKIGVDFNGITRAERLVSANAPEASFIFPAGGEEWSSTHFVDWDASDADGLIYAY